MGFGEKLQFHRKSKSMSQEQLAAKIMVSRQAVSKWELGNSLPDTENLLQISKLLNLSIDYLLNDDIENNMDIPAINIGHEQNKKKCLWGILPMLGLLGALAIIWVITIAIPFGNLVFIPSPKSSSGVIDSYVNRIDIPNYSASTHLWTILFGICCLLVIVGMVVFIIKAIKSKRNAL